LLRKHHIDILPADFGIGQDLENDQENKPRYPYGDHRFTIYRMAMETCGNRALRWLPNVSTRVEIKRDMSNKNPKPMMTENDKNRLLKSHPAFLV
jgi:hypothetical protein